MIDLRRAAALLLLAALVPGTSTGAATTLSLHGLDGSNGFTIAGAVDGDLLGIAADGIGDFNGDGVDDFLVSSEEAREGRGSTFVVFGRRGGFPARFTDAELAPGTFLRFDGMMGEGWNSTAARAGDVNDDGYADIIVGNPSAYGHDGRACVLFGSANPPDGIGPFDVDGTNGACITGAGRYDNLGQRVAALGDFNGDGVDDVAIAAFIADNPAPESGSVYVWFGKKGAWAATIGANTLDGGNGFRIDGAGQRAFFGIGLNGVGDVNGDGLADLGVGADTNVPTTAETATYPGAAYVLFGSEGPWPAVQSAPQLALPAGFRIDGLQQNDFLGWSIGRGGDVNGDAVDDLLVGSLGMSANGSAYVLFGGSSIASSLTALDGVNGSRVDGSAFLDRAGEDVNAIGDFNNDGIDDFAVAAPWTDNGTDDEGTVYLVYGKRGAWAPARNVSSLGVNEGLRLAGNDQNENCGLNASPAGDVNGDGGADVIVSCHVAPETGTWRGSAHVVYGAEPPMFAAGFE